MNIHIHVANVNVTLDEEQIKALHHKLNAISEKQDGLAKDIATATRKIIGALADPEALKQLAGELGAGTDTLKNAVEENTPKEPKEEVS